MLRQFTPLNKVHSISPSVSYPRYCHLKEGQIPQEAISVPQMLPRYLQRQGPVCVHMQVHGGTDSAREAQWCESYGEHRGRGIPTQLIYSFISVRTSGHDDKLVVRLRGLTG